MKYALLFVSMLSTGASAGAEIPLPVRTPVATIPIAPAKAVSRIEATKVDFAPGQTMPMHKHTVPVICFVSRGSFLVSIGDAPERTVMTGEATYEAPETVVHYFRDASATEPSQLLCASLAGDGDTKLNIMLDR